MCACLLLSSSFHSYVVQEPNLVNDVAQSRLGLPTSVIRIKTIPYRHAHRLTHSRQSRCSFIEILFQSGSRACKLAIETKHYKKLGSEHGGGRYIPEVLTVTYRLTVGILSVKYWVGLPLQC